MNADTGTDRSEHGHDHSSGSELSVEAARVRALETLLIEKGYVDPGGLDALVQAFEVDIGPHIGARAVAKAWSDPAFRDALLKDATGAIHSEFGRYGPEATHCIAIENTPAVHNVVVCTLCSCYPWAILGLPPVWYKSAAYRGRVVIDPRGVLSDFGLFLAPDVRIHVWDSTAEQRYLVLPMQPEGTQGWSEEDLAVLVTRDAMIGTGLPLRAEARSR